MYLGGFAAELLTDDPADRVPNEKFGFGLVQAAAAVAAASQAIDCISSGFA